MVFVVNKENLLYKRQALHRARQVSFMDAHLFLFSAERSRARTVFTRSNTEIVGSNPT
jgi:hypothetical protein